VAKIVNPTNGAVGPPLLIEDTHLFALDKVFDDFIKDRTRDGGETADDAEGAHPRVRARRQRSVIIYLSAGRTVKSDSFSDAIKQPHVRNEEPLGFRAHLEFGQVKASVTLTKLSRNLVQPVTPTQFQVVWQPLQIEFNVEPSDLSAAEELFGALENWAADFAPSRLMRTWLKYRPAFVVLFAAGLIFGLLFGFLGVVPEPGPNDTYHQQAHKLLRDGVNEKNERKAIELLLAIESKFPLESSSGVWRPLRTYWGVVIATELAFAMLSFCPTIVIGVWDGKRKLSRWKAWIRTVTYSVPALVFTTILWPQILRMLHWTP
jgi:hypothetical protein